MIQVIAAFPGVELVIKPHTRSGWKQSLTKNRSVKCLSNDSFAGDDADSAHLMNWADEVIHLATSVVFEAVRAKKPVWQLIIYMQVDLPLLSTCLKRN